MSAIQTAVVYGSLWAIGTSWSTAIREMVLVALPNNGTSSNVAGEFLAAVLTTFLAILISTFAVRTTMCFRHVTKRMGTEVMVVVPSRQRQSVVKQKLGSVSSKRHCTTLTNGSQAK